MRQLKKVRILNGKRQIDVFNEIGIWPARLSMIENGLIRPRKLEIHKLSKLYGTSPEQLFKCKGSIPGYGK